MVAYSRIKPKDAKRLLIPEQLHLLETCAHQIALALEVDKLQSAQDEMKKT